MSGWGPSEVRYTLYPEPAFGHGARRPGLRFSREEYMHILLACGALIFAFTMSFVSPLYGPTGYTSTAIAIIVVGSTVAVLSGFLLHELMHKVVAQRYGAWAEFRSSRTGLLFAIITGFLGIVFAAPGAVYIGGPLTPKQNGKVSLAGPMTNLAIGIAFMGASLGVLQLPESAAAVAATFILSLSAYINVFLGGFNLLPIPPLDGSKVFRWNKAIWVAALAGTIAVYILGAYYLGVFPRFF